jgi:hypothetical protein
MQPKLHTLRGIQRWLAKLVLELQPAELDRGNSQGYATLVRQLVLVTSELEARKAAQAPAAAERRLPLTAEALDEQQRQIEQWRARLARRHQLGCTDDRAVAQR